MAPTGSAAWVSARTWPTATRPRACRSKTSEAVSNSERRSSRLISARLLPAAARPRSCFSTASAPAGGGPFTLKVVSMLGKTARMRCHSSTRRMPSRMTGVTSDSKVMRMFSGNSPSRNSNWPEGQRKRS